MTVEFNHTIVWAPASWKESSPTLCFRAAQPRTNLSASTPSAEYRRAAGASRPVDGPDGDAMAEQLARQRQADGTRADNGDVGSDCPIQPSA
jgi:hypothetical protein